MSGTPSDVEVDLTKSPQSQVDDKKAKKLKQLRLPFAPINKKEQQEEARAKEKAEVKKEEPNSSGSAKRKRSEESEEEVTPSKVVVSEWGKSAPPECGGTKENAPDKETEEKKTPRRIQTVFLGKSSDKSQRESTSSEGSTSSGAKKDKKAKKRLPLLPADGSPKVVPKEALPALPTTPKTAASSVKPHSPASSSSPLVLEEKKFKLKVAIAKVSVAVNELNDSMEKAADSKDFHRAAEIKEKLDIKRKEKEDLEEVLRSDETFRLDNALKKLTDSAKKEPPSPSTPRNLSSAGTPSSEPRKRVAVAVTTPGTPSSGASSESAKKPKKLTPKQEQRRLEMQKKKEEKEKQKEEARLERERKKEIERKKREEERKKKEEEKVSKEMEREKLKKEKEALKEADRLLKEMEKKRREEEKEEKEKEKKLKAEAKIAEQQKKQEEKDRHLQEKKRQEDLEKQKAEKEAKNFKSFFIKQAAPPMPESSHTKEEEQTNKHFTQFRIKKNMRVAPVLRREQREKHRDIIEKILHGSGEDTAEFRLYLKVMQSSSYVTGRSSKTWPLEEVKREEDDDDEVEIIEEDEEVDDAVLGADSSSRIVMTAEEDELQKTQKRMKAKLLQFCENQRPPYWGTWSKRSTLVTGRRPFAKDCASFDYEYDSDDDWEEEEQGESLSDEEKDKEEEEVEVGEQEEDDDDGFFVGHGVLDKDEINKDDDSEEGEIEYDEELEQKKQRLRAQQFEEQYKKKKPAKLKPRIFGCMWIRDSQNTNEAAYEQLLKILKPFAAVSLFNDGNLTMPNVPIPTMRSSHKSSPSEVALLSGSGTPGKSDINPSGSANKTKKGKAVFPEDAMKDLIRLVHVNTSNKKFMVEEFVAFLAKRKNEEETISPPHEFTGERKQGESSSTPKSIVEDR